MMTMKMSIYLHADIVNTLRVFGDLNNVINDIFELGSYGNFSLVDKPPCRGRQGAARYEIEITHPAYLELYETHPHNSPVISLRRLLYWFVENEVYDEYDWQPVNAYTDKHIRRIRSLIKQAQTTLTDLSKLDTAFLPLVETLQQEAKRYDI